MTRSRLHIPSLDGIRAISIMIVFLAHAGFYDKIPGGMGVTIFFFLSGFLITTLLRVELESTGKIDLRRFYLRRVLRIFPPFYAFLAISLLAAFLWIIPTKVSWEGVGAQVLYLYNYFGIVRGPDGIPPGTDVFWSLAVEEHFYLVFPFAYLWLHRRVASSRGRALGLAIACAVVLAWRFVLVFAMHVPWMYTYSATDTRIDSILYGCLLATWRNPALDPVAEGTEKRHRLWSALGTVAGLATLLFTVVYRAPWFRETLRYSIQGLALLALFQAAVRYPDWACFRPLNWRPMRTLGVLSYSFYLVHFLVLMVVGKYVGRSLPVLNVVGFGTSLLLAVAMHHGIEKPAARLKSLWASETTPRRRSKEHGADGTNVALPRP